MQRSRQAATLTLAVLCSAAVYGATQPPSPAATASIAGLVRDAGTDAPIPRARVVASSAAGAPPHVAISGADGRYQVTSLPPGNYTLAVSRTGFAPRAYAQRRGSAAGVVSVADGQRVTGIDVALTPAGAIAGRILDEDGSPFAGAVVSALESRFENSQHVLVEVATAQTDDRGEFRIFGLPPGQYYVGAMDPAFANVASDRGPVRYAATYYPGTSFSDEARSVTVPESGEAPRVEFKLRLVPPALVTGQLSTYDRRQILSAAVVMTPVEGDGVPVVPADTVTILPDGHFSFTHVPPGHYKIRARGQTEPNGVALFSQFAVIVQGQDVANIRMTLRPGALLEGVVDVEAARGTKAPALTSLRVRAPFTDGGGFGDALTGTVQPDGKYAIRGVMDGPHQVILDGLVPPWTIKAVRLRGYDITDEILDTREGQQYTSLRLTITDLAPEVVGHVQTARGAAAADAHVLVYPIAPQFWIRTNRRLRVARTDAAGAFTIYGLPPGEYLAVASYAVDEGDLGRKDSLDALRAIATPFTIETADARLALDLRLTTALPSGPTR